MEENHPQEEHDEEYLAGLEGRDRWPIAEDIFERHVGELKRRPWLAMDESETIADAARAMVGKHIGSAIVTRKERVVGIVTERDLLNQMVEHPFDPKETSLAKLMTKEVLTIRPDDTVALAIHQMSQGGYRRIPIVDEEKKPVGMISVRDVVNYLARLFPHKILTMPPNPAKIPETREGG